MNPDFERTFGVNAGYVRELYDRWRADPASVDESWREAFEGELAPGDPERRERGASTLAAAPEVACAQDVIEPEPKKPESGHELEPLIGVASRLARNMAASLELPTATSVRTLPAKVLIENRFDVTIDGAGL